MVRPELSRLLQILGASFLAIVTGSAAFLHAQEGSSSQPGGTGQTYGPPATGWQNRAPIPQPGQLSPQAGVPNRAARWAPQANSPATAAPRAAQSNPGAAAQTLPGSNIVAPGQNAQASQAPSTLEQMPPTPPKVTYQNGQLSIQAQNSTLQQVLRSVQTQTGAQVEMPGGTSSERVVASLTGAPRDVLATLLDGSHFNYVILGVPGNSDGVQRIILTSRQSAGAQNAGGQQRTTAQFNPPPSQPAPEAEEDPAADDAQQADQPDQPEAGGDDAQNAQPPGAPGQFQRFPTPAQPPGEGAPASPDNAAPNGVKTPEQLLQELQRMQQQQQQYQQQLNPANQGQQPEPQQPEQQ